MEDIVILKRLGFFSGLNTLELSKINSIARRATFEAGEVIVQEGTQGDSMYLLKNGSATVIRAEKIIARLAEGDPIGEIAFIDKGPRSATVKADEDVILIKIPADEFNELLEKNKEIAINVYKAITETLCQRLRASNGCLPAGG